jgi:hypothetical protein
MSTPDSASNSIAAARIPVPTNLLPSVRGPPVLAGRESAQELRLALAQLDAKANPRFASASVRRAGV